MSDTYTADLANYLTIRAEGGTADDRRAAKVVLNKMAFEATNVGDVFVSSWGYDQTNVDFYKVVAKTKAMVKVVQIGKHVVSDDGPSIRVNPDKRVTEGPVMTKAIKAGYRGEATFKIASYATARRWDGSPRHETGYGFGH